MLAIRVGLEGKVRWRVLRDFIVREFRVSIDHGILELDNSADRGMSELNDLLQVGIILQAELITWI